MNNDDDAFPGRRNRYAAGGIPAIEPFHAGQLITADDVNELVNALQELDRRLRDLEARCPR